MEQMQITDKQEIDSNIDFSCKVDMKKYGEDNYLKGHFDVLNLYTQWFHDKLQPLSWKERVIFSFKEFEKKLDLRKGSVFGTLYTHASWVKFTEEQLEKCDLPKEKMLLSLIYPLINEVLNQLCIENINSGIMEDNMNYLQDLLFHPKFTCSSLLVKIIKDKTMPIAGFDNMQNAIIALQNPEFVNQLEVLLAHPKNTLTREQILGMIPN